MQKALVIGGTRFFGIHLVEELIKRGVDVTIASRGNLTPTFSKHVHRINFDRSDLNSFKQAFLGTHWDVVFDQICYSPQDALNAIEVFTDKTKKYVLTSSISVYDLQGEPIIEDDFNPYEYSIVDGSRENLTYQEGKRLAEAVFFQKAPFSVAAVRFPIVLGKNDYTKRLEFHIDKILQDKELYFTNKKAEMNFITEEEAGQFLAWVGSNKVEGPINACSDDAISLEELLCFIEMETGKSVRLASEQTDQNVSPFNLPSSWIVINEKARKEGFQFKDLKVWLPSLIHHFVGLKTTNL